MPGLVRGAAALIIAATPLAYALAVPPAAVAHTGAADGRGIVMRLAEAPRAWAANVVDHSGVLDEKDLAELNAEIDRFAEDTDRELKVVFEPSAEGMAPFEWTNRALMSNGGRELAILVVFTDPAPERAFYVDGARDWSERDMEELHRAVAGVLASGGSGEPDYTGAVRAFIDAARDRSGTSTSSVGWLAGGGLALLGVGGGAVIASRRGRRRREEAEIARARQVDPTDPAALSGLSPRALRTLAADALVQTDESIRTGEEELRLAREEFGDSRVAPFQRAMDAAKQALAEAQQASREAGGDGRGDAHHRELTMRAISRCAEAQRRLDEKAEEFGQMRDLLLRADTVIDSLTQQIVGLSARLPAARDTLDRLKSAYAPEMLASIRDNCELAEATIAEAERSLDSARALAELPAGQQGALVPTIRTAEQATTLANRQLSAIEHAEENISAARANLPALIAEIRDEIDETVGLRQRGNRVAAPGDWEGLTELVTEATAALEGADRLADTNPVDLYEKLTDLDSRLDAAMDAVRESTATTERLEALWSQQIRATESAVQGAEDTIASRGRLVGADARTLLADAQAELRAAHERYHHRQLREAIGAARAAGRTAAAAARAAREDVDRFYRQQRRQQSSGSGAFLAGMVINGLLSSGGRGGFGGGFSGGFGGGSAPGNFRGGAF